MKKLFTKIRRLSRASPVPPGGQEILRCSFGMGECQTTKGSATTLPAASFEEDANYALAATELPVRCSVTDSDDGSRACSEVEVDCAQEVELLYEDGLLQGQDLDRPEWTWGTQQAEAARSGSQSHQGEFLDFYPADPPGAAPPYTAILWCLGVDPAFVHVPLCGGGGGHASDYPLLGLQVAASGNADTPTSSSQGRCEDADATAQRQQRPSSWRSGNLGAPANGSPPSDHAGLPSSPAKPQPQPPSRLQTAGAQVCLQQVTEQRQLEQQSRQPHPQPQPLGPGVQPPLSFHHIDYSELSMADAALVGQGMFGSVYRARYQSKQVAVKLLPKLFIGDTSPTDLEVFTREVSVLSTVQHRNVVAFHGGCLTPPYVFLVEELMEGSLSDALHPTRAKPQLQHNQHPPPHVAAGTAAACRAPSSSSGGGAAAATAGAAAVRPFPLRRVLTTALDIARGLQHLHSRSPAIIHRDLKPDNILLDSTGRAAVADFGLSRCKYASYLKTNRRDAGTLAYMAPECFDPAKGRLGPGLDMFSLGVVLWEMVTRTRPWQGYRTHEFLQAMVIGGGRLPVPQDDNICPLALRRLISALWADDPLERPTADQVVDELSRMIKYMPPSANDDR